MPTDTPTKPKPPCELSAEKPTPAEQRRRFLRAAREDGASEAEAETALADVETSLAALEGSLKTLDRPKRKLGAEKLTPEEQRRAVDLAQQ